MLALTVGVTQDNLNKVYSDPYITSRISHEDRAPEPVIHPLVTYLSAWVNNIFAGCFMVIKYTEIEYEVHSLLFREYLSVSRDLATMFIEWCFSHPIERLTAYIIDGLNTAINFCLKLGFKREGARRNACKQNGQLKDVIILGLTREDWSTK